MRSVDRVMATGSANGTNKPCAVSVVFTNLCSVFNRFVVIIVVGHYVKVISWITLFRNWA